MGTKHVIILHYAAPPVVGGVESTMYHHARLLVARGYRVTIVAGRGDRFDTQVGWYPIPEVDSRHPDVLSVARALARGEVPEGFYPLKERLVRMLKPVCQAGDVIIVHNAITLHKNLPLTAALYELVTDEVSRFIAWCHDFAWMDELYTPELHSGYPWDLLRTPWPRVRYVVVSEYRRHQLAELLQLSPETIEVVPPGVDVAAFFKWEPETQRLVNELRLLEAEPLLLLPARVTRRKNIEFAIRVLGELSQCMPQAALVITGPPGPHNPANQAYLCALHELSAQLHVRERVHFLYEHGTDAKPLHVSDAMMSDLYHLADVLLFPSKREGFGIPVLEAGLARLPIFAADIPPIRESAGPWAVRFDPDGDPSKVARQIEKHLATNAIYHMRRHVLRTYTWERILETKIVPLLQEVFASS